MIRRNVRMLAIALASLLALGLTACDFGPVVLEGSLTHAETGEPLGGIPVAVYSSTDEDVVVARTRTDDDGSYRVHSGALAAGTYRVRFSAAHWWQEGETWSDATDVVVSNGASAQLDASLVPAMTTVYGETFFRVGPWPGARVDAFHADTKELVATTYSRDMADVPGWEACTGCYLLELPAGDQYLFRVSSSWGTTSWAGNVGIELPPGEFQVWLGQTAPSGFSGRIVDDDGTPVAAARVLAIPTDYVQPPLLQEATTSADGRFFVGGLYTGDHRLLVVGPDGTTTLAGMTDGDPSTATQFFARFFEDVDVGDITLSAP